jgi:hypothetical protein
MLLSAETVPIEELREFHWERPAPPASPKEE